MLFFWIILFIGIAILAIRPLIIWQRTTKIRQIWAERQQNISQDAIRLVVFGDSISEGVGATHAQYSYVSLVGDYVAQQTQRAVAILNYSVSGATTRDVLERQLPKADIEKADIILVEIGVNDSYKPRNSIMAFRERFKEILSRLPLEKTIVADMPFVEFRKNYQAATEEILDSVDVARAYPSKTFVNFLRKLPVTAGDFWHPNNKGHIMWFEAFKPGIDEVLMRSGLLKTKGK